MLIINIIKYENKIVPLYVIKGIRVNGVTASFIIEHETRWMSWMSS